MTVMNSSIYYLYSSGASENVVTFINCNIANTYADNCWDLRANFVNCILDCASVRNSDYSGWIGSNWVLYTLRTDMNHGWDNTNNIYTMRVYIFIYIV